MPEAFCGQFSKKGEDAVCILRKELYINKTSGGEIAQLVEQRTENPRVPGSIPGLATIFFARKGKKNTKPQGFTSQCGAQLHSKASGFSLRLHRCFSFALLEKSRPFGRL